MSIFSRLLGTFQTQFKIGKNNTVVLKNNSGALGFENTSGSPIGIKANTIQLVSGASAGKFLVSDASGNGAWTILPVSSYATAIYNLPTTTISSTSGSFVDVDATNIAVTINLVGSGVCEVTFVFSGKKSTNGYGEFRISDGTNTSPVLRVTGDANPPPVITIKGFFNTTGLSGNRTYKLQYLTNNGNAIQVRDASSVLMTAIEFGR